MKTILLALALLTYSLSVGHAVPTARLAGLSATSAPLAANTHLVQLGVLGHALPFSPGLMLSLVALIVVSMRVVAVHHARHMADHERDSHQGKAEMFRELHAERAQQ